MKQKIGHHLIGYGCRLIGGIPNLTLQTVSAQSIGTKGGTFLFRNIASLKGCRVCVFSHYDPDNVVDPYVLHYLAELKRAGFRIVFVSACSLSPTGEETAKLAACGVDIAIARDNIGYDFGSWACALAMEPSLYETAVLIIANDSVYGPLEPLHQLLDKMMEMESAFCGLTENEGITPHIQSYFMMFKTAAIRNPAFRQFWENIHELASKWDIIVRYEVGLTVFLRLAGIESRAVVPCGALPVNANPTHCYWSELIAEHNIPFVKRELLRDNPTRQDLSGCGELFSRYPFGSMVLKHIRAHLGRTASGVSVPPLHSK